MFDDDSENDELNNPIFTGKHPQYDSIIKVHIERAIHDIFLISLREQKMEFFYVFSTEEQIDSYISRLLKYWERRENYEICQEVVKLGKKFKRRWKGIDPEKQTKGAARISDIFGTTFT
jgi:hypothetical protein